MQNIDFHRGKNNNNAMQQFENFDPEYHTRMSKHMTIEEERNKKRASRMLFLIAALCIISFTAGLVIGIKFVGGSQRQIVDDQTISAVSNIGKRVSNLMDTAQSSVKSNIFPKNEFPFVIKVGSGFNKNRSKEVANYLSQKGHTVIISKHNSNYRLYTGPYRNNQDAEDAKKALASYNQNFSDHIRVIKRL